MLIANDVRKAVDEARYAWREFIELFAIEGRLASLRFVRLIIFALLGGLLLLIAWLLLCLAGAEILHQRYVWEWKYILLSLAGFHMVLALFAVFALRETAGQFFFPATLRQVRGRKGQTNGPTLSVGALEQERESVEASLEKAKSSTVQAMLQSEHNLKSWVTKPSVLASAVALGIFLAPRRIKHHRPLHVSSAGLLGVVLPALLNQVMSAVIASMVASSNTEDPQKINRRNSPTYPID